MSSMVIVVVALGAFGWLALLVGSGMRGRGKVEVPPNLEPFKTDDELENRRLDQVLSVAVILSVALAISLPVYWAGERGRQESFVDQFDEEGLVRGEHHVEEFACASCHGAGLAGGAAAYVDVRSGVTVSWTAPALDDIFYRYSEDEIRFWLVYGRANSPMPAWGIAGGGPMNDQMINEVIRYLEEIQVPQNAVLAQVDDKVTGAIASLTANETGLTGADVAVAASIESQEALIASIEGAPDHLSALTPLADQAVLTLETADEGFDTDEDGISDSAETIISQLSVSAAEVAILRPLSAVSLDAQNPDSSGVGDGDATTAAAFVSSLSNAVIQLDIAVEKQDTLLESSERGLAILLLAQENRPYSIDIQAVADATFDGNYDDAARAVGLYQAHCARCHTAGYSSGPAFTQDVGSGALGPALWEGRANVQFVDADQMLAFIANGSELGQGYGINGIGRGYMPAFGGTLSQDDLALLIRYLRGEVLR